MSYSLAFRISLVLLLGLTLGWKIAVQSRDQGPTPGSDPRMTVAQFLAHQHFSVQTSERMRDGDVMVLATSGTCKLRVIPIAAEAWQGDIMRQHASADDVVFVVYRGGVYAEQPKWLTLLDALWNKIRRELGLPSQVMPVLTVIASRSCNADRLPWGALKPSAKPLIGI